ncbi:MAG: tryptophan-rich sensory protein [Rhodothermales bacterium]|nr:tryptophan-rich sensory protein [Rhodothermales bacterium]
MTRSKTDRYGNIAAFCVVILFNYLANSIPLGGRTTGEVSGAYFSMFTPAGYTFAIWGVIYLLLLGFVVRQSLGAEADRASLSAISALFKVNCAANAFWLLAWHFEQLLLSMVFMVVILATLVRIYSILKADSSMRSGWDFVFLILPFGVYLGWISVATIANISILQSAYQANDFLISQEAWTILKLAVAGAAMLYFARKYSSVEYVIVIAWAALGVAIANGNRPVIEVSSLVLAVVALFLGLGLLIRRILLQRRQSLPADRAAETA